MKLSIITINKDNIQGLKKTMDSVLSQLWRDFEYIIIDGLSIDGSVSYIEDNSEYLSYWISEIDAGVYHAMNKGISVAKGEYILFLNSGDFLVDDKVLEEVFKDIHTSDILCGKCDISKGGKIVWTSDPPLRITFGTLYFQGLSHQSTFIRNDLFERIGLYSQDFKYNADIEFWYRAIIQYNASTEKINRVISNYNLEGISSRENHSPQFKNEHERILSNPLYQKFIPDYEQWKIDSNGIYLWRWLKSHVFLYRIIYFIYKINKMIKIIKI